MPRAPVGVITPVRATSNREFEADPVPGGSRQQEGGGAEEKSDGHTKQGGGGAVKSRGKRGHSPRSHVMLEQMEESKKLPRREKRPGQE